MLKKSFIYVIIVTLNDCRWFGTMEDMYMKSGMYTDRMEESLWQKWSKYDLETEHSLIIDFLNSEDGFRSFGQGLVALMQKKDSSMDTEKAIAHLSAYCKKNGVELSEIGSTNTLKSWFKDGPRPKKGEDSRDAMFALAFALEFNTNETAELFHKVYLDRAFNFRNEKELVYYFCLANGKTWIDAKRIIATIEHNADNYDATLYTSAIYEEVDKFSSESELLSYIKTHRHNMEMNNVTAKKNLDRLLSDAKNYARLEAELPEHEGQFDGAWKNEETVSVNFMYALITDTTPSGKNGTITVFNNARLPKEIKSRFPEAGSFSAKEPTYESIRKMIIMLFSYIFWYHVQWEQKDYDIEDYSEQLNALLCECGFSPLYYGNPYDWMFLYCTLSDAPLDAFREMVSDVLSEEE